MRFKTVYAMYNIKTSLKNHMFKCLKLAGADPGIYFGGPNQGSRLKVKGEARI